MMLSKKTAKRWRISVKSWRSRAAVCGRTLRRRFMHTTARVRSVVLVIIALFVTLAPMLSQFNVMIPTGA